MSTRKTDTQWGLRRARKSGLRIVEPAPNELQIDLDGAAELAFYRQQMQVLRKNLKAAETWRETITPSKTPSKFHVSITITKIGKVTESMGLYITDQLRIAFQAVLGSDLRRECFNLCRVLNGTKYPICFFEEEKCTPSNSSKQKTKKE